MPCELSNGFRDLCSMVYGGKGAFLESSFWTSVIIVGIIMLMTLTIYPCKRGTPLYVFGKLMIYSFMATFLVLSLHREVLIQVLDKSSDDKQQQEMINSIGQSGLIADEVAVMPDIRQTEKETEDVDTLLARYA
jgi:hypothetical protein